MKFVIFGVGLVLTTIVSLVICSVVPFPWNLFLCFAAGSLIGKAAINVAAEVE